MRHSYQNSILENLLSVIVTHSNGLLMSLDKPVRVWHLRPYDCGVTPICLQLDERSKAPFNSIVAAIVNSDEHQQSPLMDKWENMLHVL